MHPTVRLGTLCAATIILLAQVGAAHSASVEFVRDYKLNGDFADEDGEPHASDLSGFACTSRPARDCLAVNDQNRTAQFATVQDDRLRVGKEIKLIGKKASGVTFGKPPEKTSCSGGEAKFKDLDGEGVAYAAPYFYVVGSHGCSRRKDKFSPSSFVLARVRVNDRGQPVDEQDKVLSDDDAENAVETTFRLSDHLLGAAAVRDYFGRDLKTKSGLNIEGIAVIGPALYVGLRAPSLGGQAFVIGVTIADLFRKGDKSWDGEVIPLALGENAGIRDLAALPDGRLVVLAGPTLEQESVPYRLFIAEAKAGGRLTELGVIPNVTGKAESVSVLDLKDGVLRLLIMFDSLPNGGPREYRAVLQ